jgi:hypothetical protein
MTSYAIANKPILKSPAKLGLEDFVKLRTLKHFPCKFTAEHAVVFWQCWTSTSPSQASFSSATVLLRLRNIKSWAWLKTPEVILCIPLLTASFGVASAQ